MYRSLYIVFFLIPQLAFSQAKSDTNAIPEIKSMIIDHSGIQKFIESHKLITKKKPFLEGFRIQIYNGNNRDDANKIKSEFYQSYPNMRCYVSYQQPYYKVRVGDYPDQNSAKIDIKKLARKYPSSFLVPDQIRRTEKDEEKDKP